MEGVRRERELRNETRARAKAALTVQRHWRGFASRTTTCNALLAAWWYEFQPLVARPTVQLPASAVAGAEAYGEGSGIVVITVLDSLPCQRNVHTSEALWPHNNALLALVAD